MLCRRLALSVLGLLFLAECPGPRGEGASSSSGAPVVLISVDTLRADHLPAYGYRKVETPALDALRRDSVLFENAYTHAPLTLPAHASIFTGRLPAEHGIRDNAGYRLRPAVETLAELLKTSGYSTGGAVSSIVLSRASGVSRGFDFYDDAIEPTAPGQGAGELRRAGAETVRALTAWLRGVSRKPFFAFLHLYEPHAPYEPPEPFRSRYVSAPYDGEIAAADAVVGSFLNFLKREGLYDRCLIVFLSDHGEGLGEHGEDEHGIFLYREALHVPLFVKLPGASRSGTSVARAVGLDQVLPTLAQAVGLKLPESLASRRSLLAAEIPGEPASRVFSETLFPRLNCGWSDLSSLIDADWHFIDAPHPEIYDVKGDPGETRNLFAARPPSLRALKLELTKISRSFEKPDDVDAEQRAKLASLGYLSAGASTTGGMLPDPKDKIGTYREMKRAFALLDAQKNEEALRLLRKILGENPGMLDLWSLCAQALLTLGRRDEAAAALKQGLDPAPASATPAFLRGADLYVRMGRLDDALRQAERAAAGGDPKADLVLAQIHLARHELPRAEAVARKAIESSAFPRIPTLVLARVELARGDAAAALSTLDRAARVSGERSLAPLVTLHQVRGEALQSLRRPKESEAEYREEVRLFPRNGDAWSALALLIRAERGLAKCRLVLEEMVAANPTPVYFDKAARTLAALGDREGTEDWRRRGRARFPGDPRF